MSQLTISIVKWRFWLQWTTATLLAVAIATWIALELKIKALVFPFLFIVMSQGIISIAQSQVLKQIVPRAVRWILASFFGAYLGALVWSWCFSWRATLNPVNSFVGISFYAFFLGYAQALILKVRISKTSLWIRFTVAGLVISFIATMVIRSTLGYGGPFPAAMDWIIVSVIYGFLQASFLIFLLHRCAV